MVTITDARITGDLRDATVYYTVLGDQTEQAGTAAALESAKGMLRSRVGHALGLRHSPSLTFVLDNVQDHAKEIDDLLAAARHRDAEVQRLAAGAQYAGDPDPYKARRRGRRRGRRRAASAPARTRVTEVGHRLGAAAAAAAEPTGRRPSRRSATLAPDRPGAADLPRQPGRRRARQHARLRRWGCAGWA